LSHASFFFQTKVSRSAFLKHCFNYNSRKSENFGI